MKQFIAGPRDKYGNRRIVNLKTVTNIAFQPNFTDRFGNTKHKIIYNFNYPVSLTSDYFKLVPDYNYSVYLSEDEYQEEVNKLNDLINEKGWLAPRVNNRIDRVINPDWISFISTDPGKNRIIVNLATSVSFYSDVDRKTSDFIFLDFASYEEYLDNLKYFEDELFRKEL